MQPSEYLDAIDTAGAALVAAARKEPDVVVPSCPEWRMGDLVRHVGGVHGWVAAIVTTGKRAEFPTPPDAAGDGLADWADEQRGTVLAVLRQADPDRDCWTFGLPRTVRFWLRRQAHETTVHAWDGTNAVGQPLGVPSDLAADGLAEFLEVMVTRAVKAGLVQGPIWTGQTVHLHRTDGTGEWLVTLGPEEATVAAEHAKGDVAVRGPAEALLLWATGRRDASSVEVLGDAALAGRWSEALKF